jgi:hypothetical protein
MKINWQRGALRLWIIATVAWCAAIVVLNWNKMEVAATPGGTVHIKFSDIRLRGAWSASKQI